MVWLSWHTPKAEGGRCIRRVIPHLALYPAVIGTSGALRNRWHFGCYEYGSRSVLLNVRLEVRVGARPALDLEGSWPSYGSAPRPTG
jgi:hypothetical protein